MSSIQLHPRAPPLPFSLSLPSHLLSASSDIAHPVPSILLPLLLLLSALLLITLAFLISILYIRRSRNSSSIHSLWPRPFSALSIRSSPAAIVSSIFSSFHSLPSNSSHQHGPIRLRDGDLPLDLSPNHLERIDPHTLANLEARFLDSASPSARAAHHRAQLFESQFPPNSLPTDITLNQFLSIQEKGVSAWSFDPDYYTNPSLPILVQSRTEIHFMNDGFGNSVLDPGDAVSVQSNLPLPKLNEVYYFECKMYDKPESSEVAVGLATKPFPSFRLPGWNRLSIGYFSSDGFKSHNYPFTASSYGPPLKEGDVLGVGYRPRTGTVFFTRNGKRLEDAYVGLNRFNLFPTIGSTGPAVVHVNLGQAGFVFIEANVKKWGLAPSSGTLAPPPAYGHSTGSILLASAHQPPPPQRYSDPQLPQGAPASSYSSPSSSPHPSPSASPSRRSPSSTRHGYRQLNTDISMEQPLPPNPPTPRALDISLEQMPNRASSSSGPSHFTQEEHVRLAGGQPAGSLPQNRQRGDQYRSGCQSSYVNVARTRSDTMKSSATARPVLGDHPAGTSGTRGSDEDAARPPPRYAPVDPYKCEQGCFEQ